MIQSVDSAPRGWLRPTQILEAARLRFGTVALTMGLMLAGAYVYVMRQPSILTFPGLWAEDGTLFFKGAYEHGFGVLFEPYNGQVFVFQRIVAALIAPLPVSIQPALYAAVAVATAVVSCSFVLSSRWRLSVPLGARFVCMLALLCSPAVDEVYGILSNSHWWLAIGLVLVGLLSDPTRLRTKVGEIGFTALTALSGFAAVYAIPVLMVRAYRNRSRHSLALVSASIGGVLVQVAYLLNSARHPAGVGLFGDPKTEVIVLVRRVFAGSVLGDLNLNLVWSNRMPDTWVWLLPIALIAAMAAIWIWSPRLESLALVASLVGGWALAMWALNDPLAVLWLFQIGGRYFVVPMAALYISLVLFWPTGILKRGAVILACVLLATGILTDYHLNPMARADWAPFAECADKRVATCTTVISPDWPLIVNPPGR